MTAKVRTITPGFERNPVKRYIAGCIECNWWGFRFRAFQRAVNQMERHNVAMDHENRRDSDARL